MTSPQLYHQGNSSRYHHTTYRHHHYISTVTTIRHHHPKHPVITITTYHHQHIYNFVYSFCKADGPCTSLFTRSLEDFEECLWFPRWFLVRRADVPPLLRHRSLSYSSCTLGESSGPVFVTVKHYNFDTQSCISLRTRVGSDRPNLKRLGYKVTPDITATATASVP